VQEILAAISQGETLEEAQANLPDALKLVIECQRELAEKSISPVGIIGSDCRLRKEPGGLISAWFAPIAALPRDVALAHWLLNSSHKCDFAAWVAAQHFWRCACCVADKHRANRRAQPRPKRLCRHKGECSIRRAA
jgi:hypothetical protein